MFWLLAAIVFQLALAGRLSTYVALAKPMEQPTAAPRMGRAVVPDVP